MNLEDVIDDNQPVLRTRYGRATVKPSYLFDLQD